LGGAVGFFAYRWFYPFPMRPYIDAIAPSIALGTFFGRLGCFLNGCCYGDQCQLPWAVSFPAESAAWWHQVKAGLLSEVVLLVLLTAFYPLRRRDGEVMALLAVTYPITRFLIEYLRNDEGAFFAGLTISQNISVLVLVGGLVYWAWLRTLPERPRGEGSSESAPG
jgi:phosphatidylglycerol---prolipoprotein diacylglyceryl transferase